MRSRTAANGRRGIATSVNPGTSSGQQAGIRGDLRPLEFQIQRPVETHPQRFTIAISFDCG
jgi:hypothetical protein